MAHTTNTSDESTRINERRRRLLQGAGVTGIAGVLGGCLGGDDDGDDDTGDDDGGDEPSVESASFGVGSLRPESPTIAVGSQLSIRATITNTGEADGSQTVDVRIDGESLDVEDVSLDPGNSVRVSFDELDLADFEPGSYEFGVYSDDDEATGTLSVVEGIDPLFAEFSYEYYEGEWGELPDFDDLDPADTGTVDDGLLSLEPRESNSNYAFVFEGELLVGERLHPGEHTFYVDSDGGSRLLVDGEAVIDSPGGPADDDGAVDLSEGSHALRVEYVDPDGANALGVGWEGPYGELLPRISEQDPLRDGDEWDFERLVGDVPEIQRTYMPNADPVSFGVGLPTYTNCCFNPDTGAIEYAWRGAFVDWGPMVSYTNGRGDTDEANVLGLEFPVGVADYPLRIGDPNAEPEFEFGGYRTEPHPPALTYRVDGHEVTQTIDSPAGELGLELTFEFADAPDDTVYFLTADDLDIERDASIGEWSGTVLEVPAGEPSFTVTLTTEVIDG